MIHASTENGDADWTSPGHVHVALFLLATLLGTYLCYLIALPFLPSLAWAVGLSVLAAPYQAWLETKFGHPGLSSLACTCLLGLVVVVPASIAVQQLAVQASYGAIQVEAKIQTGEWRQVFSSQPELALILERVEKQLDLPGIAKMLATWVSGATMSLLRGSFYQLIDFGLTFYLLFFLLRDRGLALSSLASLSPLTLQQTQVLYQRINDTICATVYGSFIVAAVQGAVLGATFWFLDLPAPFLWGLMMACLALAPIAGAFIVWGPAAVFLAAEGNWGKAILLVAMGLFVIAVVDNLLRPVLVGKRLQTHTVLVFISVVGGMLFFGPSGVLLGPIALTVTQTLLELNREKSKMARSEPSFLEHRMLQSEPQKHNYALDTRLPSHE